jgi:hypothetical protein
MGAQYVLITGTHENTQQVVNTLYGAAGVMRRDRWERLPGSYHGSGCTLASAIAGCIAGGASVEDAVRDAQDYTWQTLANGFPAGHGPVHSGPLLLGTRRTRKPSSTGADGRWHPLSCAASMPLPRNAPSILPACSPTSGCAGRRLPHRAIPRQAERHARARRPRPRAARIDPPFRCHAADQRRSRAGFLVNADGVHFGADDGNLIAARAILGPERILGASCYADLRRGPGCAAAGADYVAFGAVYPSPTKPRRRPLLRSTCFFGKNRLTAPPPAPSAASRCANAPPLIAAGADLLAVITDLFGAPDIAARAAPIPTTFRENQP